MNQQAVEIADNMKRILLIQTGKGKNYSNVEKYTALGTLIREYIGEKWVHTRKKYEEEKVKQVYYLSMEFLTGTFLKKNLDYLNIYEDTKEALESLHMSIEEIEQAELDQGLGNGGLGRLAAAFLDSLSSLSLPGYGCGIRYKNGLFKQEIVDGYQVEEPDNWLLNGNIWEYKRVDEVFEIYFGGKIEIYDHEESLHFSHIDYDVIKAVPYDVPIVGYRNNTVNTLRLWSTEENDKDLNIGEFNKGNYPEAYRRKGEIESITQFLYPSDEFESGRILRLKQEYFLVSASLQSIIAQYKKRNFPISWFHEYVAIHINDTHPALAIPELMRILMDKEGMEWEDAWYITVNTMAYTNHTIMREAMETWDYNLFKCLLPRICMIVEEINDRYTAELRGKEIENEKIEKMAIISHGRVRMMPLSIVGSHSINGVAKLHTEILKNKELKDFYEVFPNNFNNKTNGIVHRLWLLEANPNLSDFIEELIGSSFKKEPIELKKLLNFDTDEFVIERIVQIKHQNKEKLAKYILEETGIVVNPYSIFDVHIKRIHEYKRQLLNILHVMHLYNKLKDNPNLDMVPRTFIFSGKAATSYYNAKQIIKLICSVASVVNNDLTIKGKLKIVFLENYGIKLATQIIPAADVSEQISTTTKEASGTGNMKFMMNGAITIATLDGANVEIANEVGDNDIVVFGLKDFEVYDLYRTGNYHSYDLYHSDIEIRRVMDQLIDGTFHNHYENFQSLHDRLLRDNDDFFILKDFSSYKIAHEKIDNAYRNKVHWGRMSLNNIASSGVFSSDYTIREYAQYIWNIKSVKD